MTINETSLIGENPSIIAPFIKELFSELDLNGLSWAVMRGWERLPEWTRYDVDILVSPKDIRRALDIANKVGSANGWIRYGQLSFGDMKSLWFLKDFGGQNYLRIDFMTGFSYRGVSAMNVDKDLATRVRTEKGFWRMPDGHAGAVVLLKQVLTRGEVDSDTRKAQVLRGVADAQFKKILADVVGMKLADQLYDAVSKKNWESVKKVAHEVKKKYFAPTPKHVAQMTCYAFRLAWRQLFPYLHCFVVFIGPDGCGKTTIADAIEHRFANRPFTSIMRIRMNFGMPRIRNAASIFLRFFGLSVKHKPDLAPGTRHMGMQKPHSKLRSIAYVTYYGLGMLWGRIRLLCWRAFSGLIIADRYFYDYYYMLGYAKCPRLYVRLMECLAPKPDIVFVLERPAADIYDQKPELTEAEIKRQQALIRSEFANRKNVRVIDASHGIESTMSAAIKEVEKWLISH